MPMFTMNGNTNSYYYKYNFISPEPTFALVKEELRTYFEAGAVDDAMFPIWMSGILKKLGKATNAILETILYQEDFESKLPPNFHGVREAWAITRLGEGHHTEFPRIIQSPNSYYEQVFCKVTPEIDQCDPCSECFPEVVRVTYKNNLVGPYPEDLMFRRTHLLKPGNINVAELCELPCRNLGVVKGADTFDLRDNKFVTNVRGAIIHLIYYSKERNEEGYQLIPDNYWIIEYVKRYLKFKIFEQLWNQTTDETYNQIKQKMDYYKSSFDEAVIMAEIEIKKKTVYDVQRDFARNANRLNPYKIR